MATNTTASSPPAVRIAAPVWGYLRKTITYNSPGSGTAMTVGVIPAGGVVVNAWAMVTTAFNDSGTDVMDIYVGTAGGTTEYMSAVSVATVNLLVAADDMATTTVATSTSDFTVLAKYTGGNADASAGSAEIIVQFCMPMAQG